MSIYLYRKALQCGDAYVYANDALREKVPLEMTVPCTLEQLHDKLAEIIEDDRILFEIPFPLNTQMPYYNYLKQLFPNSYTQANVTQNIDGVNYYCGSWNLIPSGNEGYYHSWCQTKTQYNSGDLHDVCTVISHYSYNSVNSNKHVFSIHIPIWGTPDIDTANNKLQIRTSTSKNWLNVIFDVVKQTLTFDAYGPNIASLISNGSNLTVTEMTELMDYKITEDPFTPGGHSTHRGGGRSFDDSSDPVDLPVPSTDYALNSGFLTMYQVNANKLNDLASFMWNTSLFDVEAWQKIMSNPFDAIISLTAIPASPRVLSDRAIKIGNVVTNVSAPVVADQFVRINCRTLDVEEYSGSYLDYSPYTKIEIYLPYIGFRELNTDEVMDKTLSLVYNVDVLSGACVANILVEDTVLYQFAGDCAMQIPVTGRDPAKTLSSVLGVVTSAGSLAGGAILGTLNPQSAVKAVTATAESVIGGKRNIQRSGNISGSAGFMGGQTPYLIITRPRQALPEEQNLFMGYPSFITSTLGDLSGMTIVADCHLENIPCTDGELQEIERLLKEGVIL